ncbi:hypothetical protein [Acinetobacter sp. SFB]|uniref:hypothetical protein n=1 Tax=Acinetobacter sp. SFB TaxID=1805634 RepID=UPI000A56BCC0|nr:hypothetical protein [Acinetobacter sp. SFB]
MKRLKDFKITERTPYPALTVLFIQFGDDEGTQCIVLHRAKYVIHPYREELQKLAYK